MFSRQFSFREGKKELIPRRKSPARNRSHSSPLGKSLPLHALRNKNVPLREARFSHLPMRVGPCFANYDKFPILTATTAKLEVLWKVKKRHRIGPSGSIPWSKAEKNRIRSPGQASSRTVL